MTTKIGTLRNVTLDAPDHRALGHFYRELTGATIRADFDHWFVIMTPAGAKLGFQPVPDLRRSTWPSQEVAQQLHLDFLVNDLAAATAKAESLGAKAVGGDGENFTVLTDLAGHPFCLCRNDQEEPITVFGVCLDSATATGLASFYAPLLGMGAQQVESDDAWISGDGPIANVTFQQVTDYHPPRWPDPEHPQQMHLDILVDDIDVAHEQVLALGARPMPVVEDDADWRVYLDPADHPFCLVFMPKGYVPPAS
jgi:catechol-2,3-dioxygenase